MTLPGRRAAVLIFSVAAALLGAAIGSSLAAARMDLVTARAAAEEGAQRLLARDPAPAGHAFHRSQLAFGRARGRLGNPAVRLVAAVPALGKNVDALDALAEAGWLVARAGTGVATALERVPGGPSALAPRGGAIPLQPLQSLQRPLGGAAEDVRHAERILDAAGGGLLLPQVAQANQGLAAHLRQARPGLEAAAALTRELPGFLGAQGPRRYFVGAANPAELRGTGGLIGAYAILTADRGRLSVGAFAPVQDLPTLPPSAVRPPEPSYAARYDRYGGAGFWLNVNMTPDFPSAATAIERLFEGVTGQRLDGTVVADPAALAALLEVTGPAEVPGAGTVTADTVVAFLANEAYARLPDPEARKRLLGAVASGVLQRFLEGDGAVDTVTRGRALADAAAGGHLLVHAADPAVQSAFERTQMAGRLLDPPGDYLSAIGNNAAGHKSDFYGQRAIAYEAILEPGGGVQGRATLGLANHAPTRGPPPYVIGPNAGRLWPGDNVTLLSVYAAGAAVLERFTRDGEGAAVSPELELGHRVYTSRVRLPAGGSTQLGYTWTLAEGWQGDDAGGRYRLTFQGQTTIRPTTLRVAVQPPPGMHVVGTSPGMLVDEGRAVWEGEAPGVATFEVAFARPHSEVAWRWVRRTLDRPLPDLSIVTRLRG